jgi:hypothetical protein
VRQIDKRAELDEEIHTRRKRRESRHHRADQKIRVDLPEPEEILCRQTGEDIPK